MSKIDDSQDAQMVYNPPPVNPPSPTGRVYAALGALSAIAAILAFLAGRLGLAEALAVAGQILGALSALSAVAMLYTGPPINPPGPTPHRERWLLVVGIGALGVALVGAQGGVLGFVGPAAVAAIAYALYLALGGRGRQAGQTAARGQ
jgi:hypothetical protein